MVKNAIRDKRLSSRLVRTMALLCVRNTALENIHAGLEPITRTGDYSDVTVIDADGRSIPWPEVSHFGDDTMRDLMREIVDKLYTFMICSRLPGFLERVTIWMRSASRWDEPKIVESFLPNLAAGTNYTVAPLFGVDVCRFAFAPVPVSKDDQLCRIHLFLQDPDGSQWSVGTNQVMRDLEAGLQRSRDLNFRLGLDVEACEAFAEQAMAANPTGSHPRNGLE